MQEGKPCRKNLMNGVRKSLIQICGLWKCEWNFGHENRAKEIIRENIIPTKLRLGHYELKQRNTWFYEELTALLEASRLNGSCCRIQAKWE
jgi:hypothetical protein